MDVQSAITLLVASNMKVTEVGTLMLLEAIRVHGNKETAAKAIGVSRSTAYCWLKEPPDGSPQRR